MILDDRANRIADESRLDRDRRTNIAVISELMN
jgi:hypothetical protein